MKYTKKFLANVFWQIFGNILPMCVAVLVMPSITDNLGADRLGILSIGLSAMAFQTLMTLGIDRATTKLISEAYDSENNQQLASIFKSGLLLIIFIGSIASLVFYIVAPFLAQTVFSIPLSMSDEAVSAFRVFAGWLFVELISTPFISILMAEGRFASLSAVKSLVAILTYSILFFAGNQKIDFPTTLFYILTVRSLIYFGLAIHILKNNIDLWVKGSIKYEILKNYLGFGKWVSLYGIISPFNMYFDRIVLGGMISSAAVAYYSIPTDLIMRASLIPASFAVVIFPKLAANFANKLNDSTNLSAISIQLIILLFSPVYIIISVFSEELIGFWLGKDFSDKSWMVASIIASGMLIGSVKPLFWSIVEAGGRPDLLGKLYIIVGVLNIPIVYILIEKIGIEGAAISFALRTIVETLSVAFLAKTTMNFKWSNIFGGWRRSKDYIILLILLFALILLKDAFSNVALLASVIVIVLIYYASIVFMHLRIIGKAF